MQPSDARFDELAGTIYWSDVEQDIVVEGLNAKYNADIRRFLKSDIQLHHGIFVSVADTPKEWVRNLHKAKLAYGFYAVQEMEMLDEIG